MKKDDKSNLKNHRLISLLPICHKIFECLIYNVMYNFLSENNLLSPNLSRFRSGDSSINQLLSINREISNAFDKGLEFRGIFPDISKAFGEVWIDSLIFKLRQNGIGGDIVNILRKFPPKSNLEVPTFPPQHGFEKFLCDHYITIIF